MEEEEKEEEDEEEEKKWAGPRLESNNPTLNGGEQNRFLRNKNAPARCCGTRTHCFKNNVLCFKHVPARRCGAPEPPAV